MSLINSLFTFTSQHTRFEHPWRLPFGSNVMDGLNVTYALGVSVSFSMDVVVYVLGMCMRQMLVSWLSVLPVPLPLLSWRALMHLAAFGTLSSPLLLCYTRTSTSTISQDKLGFSDFLQILLQIRENNLKKKTLHRQRHEYKRAFLEASGKEPLIQKPELPGSCLSTWWLASASSCRTVLLLVFALFNSTLCWNSFIT